MQSKITILIIDDEAIARQIIAGYCAHLPEIEVVGQAQNAFIAKNLVDELQPDLIFLDINMPVLDGMAFIKTLKVAPLIVFTTAYKEFAHEAFDLHAVDYLLKPFSLERFIVAIDKVKEKLLPVKLPYLKLIEEQPDKYTFVKFDGKIHKIDFEKLLYIEAQGNSIKIVSQDFILSPGMTLSTFEDLLPSSIFVRIHRSFIVNKSKIKQIEGNRVFVDKTELPIGANYKDDFLTSLGL
jgi:DNA-binding LytR/AlgR family response regulator